MDSDLNGRQAMPEAKYTKFGEKIRHVIPGPMQCSMACGGRNCKWENPSKWSDEDQVIKGVFSSWVLEDVVAMSRPSTEVIEKYDLIEQFKQNKISSIINLQRPGEHASCGPPLNKESQFTYLPQVFMDNNIFFYNFGWKDYGVTSLETILDMVKVMAFALSEGKVAVHCHAGLGRTGVLIACFLVFAHRMDASSAVNAVRKRRPNSIQTRGQIACIQEFAQFLKPLRIVFPQVVPHAERLNLMQFLHRQRHMLHGFESRELRYIPKIISIVCQRLVEIATTSRDNNDLYELRTRSNTIPKPKGGKKSRKNTLSRSNTVETLKETLPGAFVNEHLDESFLNPIDSQEIKALLSPRVRRKSESVKPKSRSLSRPESPVTNDQLNFNSNNINSEPILVTSVAALPTFFSSTSDQIGDTGEKIPGKPQVVLVKQGSRSGLLSTATNISQTQQSIDVNINNNNQVVSLSSPIKQERIISKKSQQLDQKTSKVEKSEKVAEINIEKITTACDSEIETETPSLPSPTPSVHEPLISPRGKAPSKDTQNAGGDKPTLQNIRSSAGRSQRILPTGMPAYGRLGSGKGRKITLFADDEEEDSKETFQDMNADKESEEKITDEIEQKIVDEKDSNENSEASEREEAIPGEVAQDLSPEPDVLDHELEEIFEIKDEDGPYLTESDSEKEDAVSKNFFSQSAASKVSWTEQLNNKETDDTEQKLEELVLEDETLATETPLMYRPERNQERLESTEVNYEDSNSENTTEENEKHTESFSNEDELADLTSMDHNISPGKSKRPKSAGFLKRMSEKNQQDLSARPPSCNLQLTQSLCDLRHHEGTSHDDISALRSDMNSIFLPLSPSSKSSSSDDVRTPTGSALKRRIKDPITVAMALAYKLTDNEWLWEKVYTKQVELNTREGAWSVVEQEVDAHLLSCLMWSWVEHLSEPALTNYDVDQLIDESRPNHEKSTLSTECPDPSLFKNALLRLGKPIASTLQCVLDCLLRLPPLSFELEASVVRRVTSAFTQSYNQDENNKKHEQLVCLIQNYLVKTRGRNLKKQSSSDEKNSKENDATSTNIEKGLGTTLNNVIKESDQNGTGKKDSANGEGDTSSSTKLSELNPPIAVS